MFNDYILYNYNHHILNTTTLLIYFHYIHNKYKNTTTKSFFFYNIVSICRYTKIIIILGKRIYNIKHDILTRIKNLLLL